ncbi:unnamed protein product [Bursaphelenchus okinawaensis]|uniref:Uncharacterized protein n=1 Tax=Bursaphelenchus okinawaensis TaxID=465554 RepID=A0A811L8A2_9BILA|nr:unnamed protein product [Bursaphelenchus okinawaensis]CAG9119822.1 unnamed protein product [Bursaphelenchus okinawaensis]
MASALSALLEEPTTPPKLETDNPTPVGSPRHDRMLLENEIVDQLANSSEVLPKSGLGNAIDNLIVQWNQLLGDFSASVGYAPPSLDHVKEKAEYSVKQVREAGLDVHAEINKVMLEWRLSHPREAIEEDIKDFEEVVERQNALLASVNERLDAMEKKHDDGALD